MATETAPENSMVSNGTIVGGDETAGWVVTSDGFPHNGVDLRTHLDLKCLGWLLDLKTEDFQVS